MLLETLVGSKMVVPLPTSRWSLLIMILLGNAETAFSTANLRVFSNAKNHRMDPHVPLVVPTVNLKHLDVLAHQQKACGLDQGFIVCNSNCAVVALVVPLAALQARFGPIECCSVVTLQAVRFPPSLNIPKIRVF